MSKLFSNTAPNMTSTFMKEYTKEQRLAESNRIRSKHSDRVPVICERMESNNTSLPLLQKKKYLVPADLTMGQFMYFIRKQLNSAFNINTSINGLGSEVALFLFINGRILSNGLSLGNVYNIHKNEDGFLYVCYTSENTFG